MAVEGELDGHVASCHGMVVEEECAVVGIPQIHALNQMSFLSYRSSAQTAYSSCTETSTSAHSWVQCSSTCSSLLVTLIAFSLLIINVAITVRALVISFFFHNQICGLLPVNLSAACQPHSLKRERWGLSRYGLKPGC